MCESAGLSVGMGWELKLHSHDNPDAKAMAQASFGPRMK